MGYVVPYAPIHAHEAASEWTLAVDPNFLKASLAHPAGPCNGPSARQPAGNVSRDET